MVCQSTHTFHFKPTIILISWPNVPLPSVQFSQFSSVVSNSLWPRESQHARPPCPSPTSGVHSKSCASSRWCHPAISSSVVPFSSCPKSLPASGSFPMSQLFAWGGQSTGVSAWTSVLPPNEHPGLVSFRMDWLDLLAVTSIFSSTSINSSAISFLHSPTLTSIHDHWKTIALTRQTFVGTSLGTFNSCA